MIDVEVARTFLAVIEAGTFLEASKKVNVTQSTVSMRIRTLEERLGRTVFERSRTGASLTPAGIHFERYARAIVRAWEQGRHQAGVTEQYDELLVIGGQYSLWNQLLTQWLISLREELPRLAFRAEVGTPLALGQRLTEGLIDIAVMHQPRLSIDIEVEHLMDDELILVTTDPNGGFEDRYAYVDWGPSFQELHAQKMPEQLAVRTTVALGFFGAPFLITANMAGYMPRRVVNPHIDEGYLFEVSQAPSFPYPLYVAYQSDTPSQAYDQALDLLRRAARDYAACTIEAPFWSDEPPLVPGTPDGAPTKPE
ncbi:MAG: LysR family transcriptional regulator [Alphaproteobacteria bacterium]|jgi:DNA-binding transcriptional LysR family regulator|nr:LysR family transcriptional regulator [Alphaproteobacteria bacterium]